MFSTNKLCATTLYGDKETMGYMVHAGEISLGDKPEELNKSNKNARQVFIKHEKQIIKYANNIIELLRKANRNQIIDDTKDEASKIIASCQTFLDILENT